MNIKGEGIESILKMFRLEHLLARLEGNCVQSVSAPLSWTITSLVSTSMDRAINGTVREGKFKFIIPMPSGKKNDTQLTHCIFS